ncbi:MAG: 2-amino-4-hydroxy-6-hydroxymethyldihydropteridine diphosphokinase [Agathobacter sp.]|nr:2-amino-4-hydroxy-6-hydroxymethyldihydropteridine diphosphokinase [Agathobacter sp.]
MIRRTKDFIKITNLEIYAYHGVLEEEKQKGQIFFVNLKLYMPLRKPGLSDALVDAVNYDEVCSLVVDVFTKEVYDLIEKAAEKTVEALMHQFPALQAVEMELRKPDAPITCAPEDVSVNIYREWHKVYLSIGSNHENAMGYLEEACKQMTESSYIKNFKQSGILQTKPYGPVEQPDFQNGCVSFETYMEPEELLAFLNQIEANLKRERIVRWGPRTIDLDILFYDDIIYNSDILTIPHIDMQNRMFVLEPLFELCPYFRHPILGKSVEQMRAELMQREVV